MQRTLILVKQDGAVLYGTTDLATIIDRVREQNPDLILYVVDQRQHLELSREVVRRSFPLRVCEPSGAAEWREARERFSAEVAA